LFTGLTQSAIQPSAERYFIFFCVLVFALYERKNQNTDKTGSTMLPFLLSRGALWAKGRLKAFESGTV
jgi:hypothetical protein